MMGLRVSQDNDAICYNSMKVNRKRTLSYLVSFVQDIFSPG